MEAAGGVMISRSTCAAVTVTAACWLVPESGPAVTTLTPSLLPRTGKIALFSPASTVTRVGTSALGSLMAKGTTVARGWAGAMVTSRPPAVPLGRESVAGAIRDSVGASWLTVTVAWAVAPLSGPAVTDAVPTSTPVTAISAEARPAGTVTVAGTG